MTVCHRPEALRMVFPQLPQHGSCRCVLGGDQALIEWPMWVYVVFRKCRASAGSKSTTRSRLRAPGAAGIVIKGPGGRHNRLRGRRSHLNVIGIHIAVLQFRGSVTS